MRRPASWVLPLRAGYAGAWTAQAPASDRSKQHLRIRMRVDPSSRNLNFIHDMSG